MNCVTHSDVLSGSRGNIYQAEDSHTNSLNANQNKTARPPIIRWGGGETKWVYSTPNAEIISKLDKILASIRMCGFKTSIRSEGRWLFFRNVSSRASLDSRFRHFADGGGRLAGPLSLFFFLNRPSPLLLGGTADLRSLFGYSFPDRGNGEMGNVEKREKGRRKPLLAVSPHVKA